MPNRLSDFFGTPFLPLIGTCMQHTEHVQPHSLTDWRDWFARHHARATGVWCVTFKKGKGATYFTYDELVAESLCWGWVDSRPGKVDEERTKLYFAPRKAGSGWSRPNKIRVEKLIAEKRMQPAGLALIEAAKKDGSWAMLDAVENLETPDDLAAALKTFPNAALNWDAFPRSAKRGILEWIAQAKTAPTREKRVQETVRLANENVRANQWTPKK
jgi:uncharacterized protein YdeI (YjbR/CyaY-like superfamily)